MSNEEISLRQSRSRYTVFVDGGRRLERVQGLDDALGSLPLELFESGGKRRARLLR